MKKNVFRIQTPIVLFSLSDDYINNITSFFSGGMSKNEILLTNRFKLSKLFPGTQKFQSFISLDLFAVKEKICSFITEFKNYVINFNELKVDVTIACVYLGKWYIEKY
jgi:hypothetical protein